MIKTLLMLVLAACTPSKQLATGIPTPESEQIIDAPDVSPTITPTNAPKPTETPTPSPSPTAPRVPTSIIAIDCGHGYSIVLEIGGRVWAIGMNREGQLGDGTATNRASFVKVAGLESIIAVSTSLKHSLAVDDQGSVWAWGSNGNGQLGNIKVEGISRTPVPVADLSGVAMVSAGSYHSLAVREDGTVWSWGLNEDGQLGDGTTSNRDYPVQVKSLSGIMAIAGGTSHSVALKEDGTVWTWGSNQWGQLGNGTLESAATPIQVMGLSSVTAVASKGLHTLALLSNGKVKAWGSGEFGQLGNGVYGSDDNHNRLYSRVPVDVAELTNITAIASGYSHSLALKEDRTVWAWGSGDSGVLGKGASEFEAFPSQVPGLTDIIAIAGSTLNSLALKEDQTLWGWGDNHWGQLGKETDESFELSPIQIVGK